MAAERKINRNGEPVAHFLIRIPESLDEKVQERANAEQTSKADIIRRALRRYLRG